MPEVVIASAVRTPIGQIRGGLAGVRADDLLELALQVGHDHEGGIAMHQNPQAARKRQRFRQDLQRRDRLAGGARDAG